MRLLLTRLLLFTAATDVRYYYVRNKNGDVVPLSALVNVSPTTGPEYTNRFNLHIDLGGAYVNDFNRFGRLFKVYVQAEPEYRKAPTDVRYYYVRNKNGDVARMRKRQPAVRRKPASDSAAE